MTIQNTAKLIGQKFRNIPKIWDGKKSILEMKNAGYPYWKQMEWIDFYFQFLCEKCLSDIMDAHVPKYGKVDLTLSKRYRGILKLMQRILAVIK